MYNLAGSSVVHGKKPDLVSPSTHWTMLTTCITPFRAGLSLTQMSTPCMTRLLANVCRRQCLVNFTCARRVLRIGCWALWWLDQAVAA